MIDDGGNVSFVRICWLVSVLINTFVHMCVYCVVGEILIEKVSIIFQLWERFFLLCNLVYTLYIYFYIHDYFLINDISTLVYYGILDQQLTHNNDSVNFIFAYMRGLNIHLNNNNMYAVWRNMLCGIWICMVYAETERGQKPNADNDSRWKASLYYCRKNISNDVILVL